jgi:iron complex outermembrane recepter protein
MSRTPRPTPIVASLGAHGWASSISVRSMALLSLACTSLSALGQSNPEPAQVVTVTATKRTQPLQEVPLSVSVKSGADLERTGTQRWEDALTGEPSVMISETGDVRGRNISIRGVSDGVEGALTQSTVALYIDEMPVTVSLATANPSLLLFDINQVSVIRGPRSTLYGASSLGGTVKVETLNPSLRTFEGSARVGFSKPSSSGKWGSEAVGSVSVPLSENKAALGFTAYRVVNAGYLDTPTLGKDRGEVKTSGARATLYAEPTKGLSITTKLYFQEADNDTRAQVDASKGKELIAVQKAVLESSHDRFSAGALTVKYKTDAFEFVSATSASDKRTPYLTDLTSSFGPFLVGFGVPAGTPLVNATELKSKVKTQEFRLVSTEQKTGLFWSAGIFYSDEKTKTTGTTPSPIGDLFGANSDFHNNQKAAFGELGMKWDSGLELSGGVRRTKYETVSDVAINGLFGLPGSNMVKVSESTTTPHLSLAYRFGRQMVYAQASKGFRPGRANFPVIPEPGVTVPGYATSDSLWTYELGAKSSWLDNQVTANVAVYQTRWKNPQLTLTQANGFSYVDSLGKLNPGAGIDVKGIDIDLIARLAKDLRISAGLGYTDSTFDKDVVGLIPNGTVAAGSRTSGTPHLTANVAIKYDLSVLGNAAVVDAVVRHVGSYMSDFYSGTRQLIGERTTLDLRLNMALGNFDTAIYVNNATDQRPRITYLPAPFNYYTTIRPRTIGAVASYRF